MTGVLLALILAAPASAAGVWREGMLRTPGAGAIHYRLRSGEGEGVLLVHGRSFGSEAFSLWEGLLPGRPLMILDRRGYAPSQGWAEPLGERNQADIARALSFLRSVSGSKKAAVAVFSMGGRFLPELDPEQVSWVAMVNPSGPRLVGYLDARGQAAAESLREGYERTRFWLPFAREAWIASAAWSIASDA
ncbi:MAG: alpha/beta hydrolase, partial [Elusimicrobiota bacterium]